MASHHGITIEEAFKDFVPPVSARKVVDRLLSGVPQKYLFGLKTVVLTNAAGLSHDRRRRKTRSRKRKVAIRECRGLYHRKWKNEPAWIEIFVDNLCAGWPIWVLRIPPCRDIAFAEVLFHELGHHIHKTRAPEYDEREDVAEKWERQLTHIYLWPKYWYIMLPARIVARALKPFQRLKNKT